MIHIVTPENDFLYRDEMEQAYRLRHNVFVEEMGWTDIAKPDGREIDQFDDKYTVHMLYTDQGKVLGYQRVRPTTRPNLLSEIMPELCEGELPCAPHIWEWTRHCIAKGHRERGPVVTPISNALMSSVVEWGLENGVTSFIVEVEPTSLLRLVQLHFRPLPLGLPRRIGGQDTIALMLNFDGRTLNRLQEMSGSRRRVLAKAPERPVLLHA